MCSSASIWWPHFAFWPQAFADAEQFGAAEELRSQLRPAPSSLCPLHGCLSSLSCNLLLCPAGLSLTAELTLVQRKWDWCFVRRCFSLFLSLGIELQRQRALAGDGVSGEMSNAGPDCSAVIKHLREDVPGRGMLTLWSWTDSSSFNYSFHHSDLLCTFDHLWDFFPPIFSKLLSSLAMSWHIPHTNWSNTELQLLPLSSFSNSLYFLIT